MRRKILGLSPWAVLLFIIAFVSAAVLFSQTFPTSPTGTTAVLTPNCATLTANTGGVIGTAGTELYTCGSPPGLTTNAFAAIAGTATPTFSPPANAGTVSLSFIIHSATATTCTAGTPLASGTPVAFAAGSFDYCLSYSSYPSPGIASFMITWSQ